jgi:hypothetical protein
MSFVDNHPPRHNNIGNFVREQNKSKYHKGLIAKLICGNHYTVYTCQELRAVILMKEKPITGYLSHKQYKMHLEQKERIKQFLEQEKLEKNKEQSL